MQLVHHDTMIIPDHREYAVLRIYVAQPRKGSRNFARRKLWLDVDS